MLAVTPSLAELVIRDREITQARADIEAAILEHEKGVLSPIRARERAVGERSNELWLKVLDEYGPGYAQDALRAAKVGV